VPEATFCKKGILFIFLLSHISYYVIMILLRGEYSFISQEYPHKLKVRDIIYLADIQAKEKYK